MVQKQKPAYFLQKEDKEISKAFSSTGLDSIVLDIFHLETIAYYLNYIAINLGYRK